MRPSAHKGSQPRLAPQDLLGADLTPAESPTSSDPFAALSFSEGGSLLQSWATGTSESISDEQYSTPPLYAAQGEPDSGTESSLASSQASGGSLDAL